VWDEHLFDDEKFTSDEARLKRDQEGRGDSMRTLQMRLALVHGLNLPNVTASDSHNVNPIQDEPLTAPSSSTAASPADQNQTDVAQKGKSSAANTVTMGAVSGGIGYHVIKFFRSLGGSGRD
jgi:hypothetical protein